MMLKQLEIWSSLSFLALLILIITEVSAMCEIKEENCDEKEL